MTTNGYELEVLIAPNKAVEPNWDERLTITVGPKEADIVGTSHKALQAAVNYVASLGGGTVTIGAEIRINEGSGFRRDESASRASRLYNLWCGTVYAKKKTPRSVLRIEKISASDIS